MPRSFSIEHGSEPSRLPARLGKSVAAAGAYAIAAGLVTFAGWIFDVPRLTDWPNGGISMMPNTAIAAATGGLALVLFAAGARRVVMGLGALTSLIGATALFQHLTGINLGTDTLILEPRWGLFGTVAPGRMGPPAATSFTLAGLGLVLLGRGRKNGRAAVACAVAVLAMAMLSLIGYLFGASPLFTLPRLTAIAFQTATVTLALAAGIILALPDYQPMKTLMADTGAGILARRALPFIALLPIALGWLRVMGQNAQLYDTAFGSALRTIVEVGLLVALLSWGVARVAAHEREVKHRGDQIALFLETAAIGLHRVGPGGQILWANNAELRMLGYAPDEYIGRHISEFHADRDVIDDVLGRLLKGEKLYEYPARMIAKDRSIRHVLIDSSGLFIDGRFVHSQCFTRDVTERQSAERARMLLAAIVDSSDDAIISKSLDGTILSWNAGAERLLGYTASEAVGKPIALVIPDERWPEERMILDRLRRGERISHYETARVSKQGRLIDVSLSISPVRDASGQIVAASSVARDITERKRAEREREQLLESERAARSQAEQAGRLKDEFLATVSHELRTPLNGILGWTQVLKRTRPDQAMIAEGLDAIERSGRMQAQIIEDLLDMNRIVSGKLRLDVQSLELAPIIEAALETVRPGAEAKGVRIQALLNPSAGPIRGDPTRLQQVVWNLLSNAVKFTPKGGRVQVLLERMDSHVEISVTDTGIGIKPEFLPHVFERFMQADSSATRKHGGLGLGLAIVRQIVELHGGTVAVTSEGDGKGATFNVRLPISIVQRPPELELPQPPAARFDAVELSGVRILVVDDDPGACEVMRRLLVECRAEVETVGSGQLALDRLAAAPPDVLLCDIGMPGMDGYEVIRTARERGLGVPAVAVTAFARAEDRIKALQSGFNMHLSKPLDARELLTVIQTLLQTAPRSPRPDPA